MKQPGQVAIMKFPSANLKLNIPEIRQLAERIWREAHPEEIYLFGSYATGTAGPDSDVDFLVVTETDLPRHKRARAIRRLLQGSGVPVDILVRTREEFEKAKDRVGTVSYCAAHAGKLLYGARSRG